ncbi:hypothetical protein ISG07_20095, partial [Burkholderia pseudomallei]|nr:hypothetical protein [Burkholderia pseudomallei]MBF3455089.1 hypothetical protein [Burkholderia pseudomallei]MBF3478894.1 hypothetical protein [Burkholderia pseudomallei]MBF3484764.1 hypothetical protein [Burkholderia pseudomallei]MBF3493285.1 hypothetical protein [Burkholderia pseudomallei]
CRVEPNDPNVWPIPASIGEFAATVPGFIERAREKAQRSQAQDNADRQPQPMRKRRRRRAQ